MKTFIFIHKHISAELVLSAENYQDALWMLKNLVINTEFWRIDNKEGENE